MRNIKLVVEYDGTDFCGWQVQPNERTVQGVLQKSSEQLFQEPLTVIGAGRTDAGVHALGQVANFRTESKLKTSSIKSGLNTYLPQDIRVLNVEQVAEEFHSRYDARRRSYRYVISKRQRAINRHYSWFCKYELDIGKLNSATEFLLGQQIFEAFSKYRDNEEHYICNVDDASWQETAEEFIFSISANRFLHKMVRIVVGTMVDVGRGKRHPEEIRDILDSRDRTRAGFAVPAHGLFLVKVDY